MDITLLQAEKLINEGQVIGVPTETVYGLAASLYKLSAIDQIFSLKGRPANNPLIIHVASVEDVLPFIEMNDADESFYRLAKAFWPGPLTLVLPIIEEKIPARVRANLKTAAFRIPEHALARELLKLTGPLVMPSANLSGKPSATSRIHVEQDFGKGFPVLDGGECLNGLESTILYKNFEEGRYQIIRQGALTSGDFLKVLGYEPEIVVPKPNEKVICPGQLYRHYAPKAKLTLTKEIPDDYRGVVVGFEDRFENKVYPEGCVLYSLGKSDVPKTISKNLYRVLRKLDEDGVGEAFVDVCLPDSGEYSTILERLGKASV